MIHLHEANSMKVSKIDSATKPFYTLFIKGDMRYKGDEVSVNRNNTMLTAYTDKQSLRLLRHKINTLLCDADDLRDVVASFAARIADEDLHDMSDEAIVDAIMDDIKEAVEQDEKIPGLLNDVRMSRWEDKQERRDPLAYHGIPKPEL